MSKPLSILDQGNYRYYDVSEHGIEFKTGTPQGEWLETVNQLCGMFEGTELAKQRTLMLLADALNYGESSYGEQFAAAIDATREHLGLSPKTIANAQWTYKRIAPGMRVSQLTLGHYSVIAAFNPEEQQKYIEQVVTSKMTIATLKEIVAEEHPKTKRGATRKTSEETEATALQKLEDVLEWIEGNGISEKWKIGLEAIYKVFRRKWQTGRRRR